MKNKLELKSGQMFLETRRDSFIISRQWLRRIDYVCYSEMGYMIFYTSILSPDTILSTSSCLETSFRTWIHKEEAILLEDKWKELFNRLIK
jgi:hypothetical protein